MSHEFRTPLNAMLGYTSMLLQGVAGPVEPPVKRQLGRIESNGRHLLTIINEILDISRIEAGRMPLQLSTFKHRRSRRRGAAELEPIILRSKLTITLDLPKDLRPITSDRQKVKQILLNLLSNALKFTHQGARDDQRAAHAERAHGRAVGDRYRHRHRAGRSGQDFRGLPPARQLADPRLRRHRARSVDLPPARPDARRPYHGAEPAGQGIDLHVDLAHSEDGDDKQELARPRVLLVDDYPDAREMYGEYLEFSGFDVVQAANGMEALQRAVDDNPTSS